MRVIPPPSWPNGRNVTRAGRGFRRVVLGAAIAFACSAGGVYAAQGTDSSSKRSGRADVACCVRFSSDSKSHLYKPGDRAVVEAMFADKAGNALKQGVVELWADDGWTNRVWTRTIDLAKDSQPVRMELSRSTPGSLRIHAKGASIRERMDRILFGVDEIMPLTPCPGGIAAFNCIASKDKRLRLLPGRGHGWHKADLERWLFNLEPTCTATSKKGTEQ